MYTTTTTEKACEAHIAINHSRLKSYDKNRYYLKDKTNFEIEVFNPHSVSALARIKMNGEYISTSGLILKPGQRVFLSRYLDTNNSFLFETYDVENNHEVLEAIANNGKIEVEFFLEQKYTPNLFGGTTWITTPNVYYSNTLGNSGTGSYIAGGHNSTFTSINANNFDSINTNMPVAGSSNLNSLSIDASLETGRIEKGKKTNQKMETGFGSYNSWPTNLVSIQLFPESIKPIEVSEIRTYCTECGTRMKKQTWKFCPNCGTKND